MPIRANEPDKRGALYWVRRGLRRGCIHLDNTWLRYSYIFPGKAQELELRVMALRRSGHHAVISWIAQQIPGRVLFLNNCAPSTNPYETCIRSQSEFRGFFFTHREMNLSYDRHGRHSRKAAVIYNYEDLGIPDIVTDKFEKNRQEWLGESKRRVDALILRDPLNLLASKLKWSRGKVLQPDKDSLLLSRKLWKDYAREALGDTKQLPDKIVIDFNLWFLEESYRNRLRTELGLDGNDRSMRNVAHYGPATWGDSFDGLDYDGKANEMKVLERWKHFVDDDEYLDLLRDGELLELHERLYGNAIKGSEELLLRLFKK